MSNLIFTADWHIKLGQKNVPVDWQKNRFTKFFVELLTLAETRGIELLIIGGDIFDRVPTIEELELYFDFLNLVRSSPVTKVYIYSGNHEALKKNTTFLSNLKAVTFTLSGNKAEILDSMYHSPEGIDFLPYNKLKEYEKSPVEGMSNILCTHVRGEIPPHVTPEVDLDIFNEYDIVLAGDLHSYGNCQRNILYPGSPMTTSFHRDLVASGVLIVNRETLRHEFVPMKLPQLLRKSITDPGDAIPTEFHHTMYELEGDLNTLAQTNSAIIDKKIAKKDAEPTTGLKFTGNMRLEDEIEMYAKEKLGLKPEQIKRLLACLHDNIKDLNLE